MLEKFFASGVSNSKCEDETQYDREYKLLLEQPKDKHLVYFSSLSIYRSNNRYNKHKKAMEQAVEAHHRAQILADHGHPMTWRA